MMIDAARRDLPPIVRISIVTLLPIHERIHAALAIRWELSVDQFFRIREQGRLDRNLVQMMQAMPAALLDTAIERVVARQPRPMHNPQCVSSMKEEAQRKLITEDTRLLCTADLALEKAFAGVADDGSIEAYWSLMREQPELHERYEKAMMEAVQGLIGEYVRDVMAAREAEAREGLGRYELSCVARSTHKYALMYHSGLMKRFHVFCLREAERARGNVVSLYWYKKLVFYGTVLVKMHSQITLKEMAKEHAAQRQQRYDSNFRSQEISMRLNESFVLQGYEYIAQGLAEKDAFTVELYTEDTEKMESLLVQSRSRLSMQEGICDESCGRTEDIIRATPRFSRVERLVYETSFGLRSPPLPRIVNVDYFYNQMRDVVIQRLHAFVDARAPAKG